MKVLVCGDRFWTNKAVIRERLFKLPRITTVITGGCYGADYIADQFARELDYTRIIMPADWKSHGKAAGPIRNRAMLDLLPDLVVAFHNDLSKSRGTVDTVNEAMRRKIKVEIYNDRGEVR